MGCGSSNQSGGAASNASIVPENDGTAPILKKDSAHEDYIAAVVRMKRNVKSNIRGVALAGDDAGMRGGAAMPGSEYSQLETRAESNRFRGKLSTDGPDEQTADFILKHLESHWLFGESERSTLQNVIAAMRSYVAGPENDIVIEEEEGSEFFIIEKGECSVRSSGTSLNKTLSSGDCFGELSLFYHAPRSATVATMTECTLWVLDQVTFRKALKRRNEEIIAKNAKYLAAMPTFSNLSASKLDRLAVSLNIISFTDGQYIIKQGEAGSIFYIMFRGVATVEENGKMKEHLMEEGDWFGETALVSKAPRSASVIAKGDVLCAGLAKEEFEEILGDVSEFTSMKKGSLIIDPNSPAAQLNANQGMTAVRMQLSDISIGKVLGVGGFGLVSLCTVKSSGEVFALKKMQKQRIVEADMQRMIVAEKNFLCEMKSPFILGCAGTCSDDNNVYLVLPFLQGGDLFGLLEKRGCLSEQDVRFYAGCTTLALEHVHQHSIAFRDLKLENLVMDGKGYLKLVDFGLAKRVMSRTYTVCGSPRYCAPEMVTSSGHNQGVDWWALGIVIYECLTADSPFAGDDNIDTFRRIMNDPLRFPSSPRMSSTAKSLVKKLLEKKAKKRLGCMFNKSEDVRSHPFFKKMDWTCLALSAVAPPYEPKVSSPDDTSEFPDEVDIYEEHQDQLPYDPEDDPEPGWCDEF
eukprot:g3626.t1